MKDAFKILSTKVKPTFKSITPDIPGTLPEKMVYDYLQRLGVRTQFQYHMAENYSTMNPESTWIPDFILPDYNIIIEIYGHYWHSIPRTSSKDAVKKLWFMNSGYSITEYGVQTLPSLNKWSGGKLVVWWDYEIYSNLGFLFARDLPEIAFGAEIKGEMDPFIQDKNKAAWKKETQRARLVASKIIPKRKALKTGQRRRKRRSYVTGSAHLYSRKFKYKS